MASGVDPTGAPTPAPTLADLRRRVLLTFVACTVAFGLAAAALAAVQAPDLTLLGVIAVLYLVVARPLLAPVRTALRQRRDLAYLALQEQRRRGGSV